MTILQRVERIYNKSYIALLQACQRADVTRQDTDKLMCDVNQWADVLRIVREAQNG